MGFLVFMGGCVLGMGLGVVLMAALQMSREADGE